MMTVAAGRGIARVAAWVFVPLLVLLFVAEAAHRAHPGVTEPTPPIAAKLRCDNAAVRERT